MKIIKTMFTAAIVLITTLTCSAAKEYTAEFMRKAPKIDGDIKNDAAWSKLPWTSDFKTFKKCTSAKRPTRFKVGYTYDGLYIAAECDEPQMNKISASRKDLEDLWHDDNIEFFVSTGKLKYRHFVVNAAGSRGNVVMTKGLKSEKNYLWEWQAKARRNPGSWTVEAMIPYHLLEFFPDSRVKVKFNVGRTATPIKETSSWSPQRISFHDIAYFGALRFGGKLSLQELNKLSQTRTHQRLIAKSVMLKRKWNKLKQILTGSSDSYYKDFTNAYKAQIASLDNMIKNLSLPTENKYQTSQRALEQLKQQLITFDQKLGELLILKLTNN